MLPTRIDGPIRCEDPVTLPDGRYKAIWTAYTARFSHDGKAYTVDTSVGVRGINCPCVVVVENGCVTVEG